MPHFSKMISTDDEECRLMFCKEGRGGRKEGWQSDIGLPSTTHVTSNFCNSSGAVVTMAE